MSAEAGTVKGMEYVLVAPEKVSVATEAVEELNAVALKPSAGFEVVESWANAKDETASTACIQPKRAIPMEV